MMAFKNIFKNVHMITTQPALILNYEILPLGQRLKLIPKALRLPYRLQYLYEIIDIE